VAGYLEGRDVTTQPPRSVPRQGRTFAVCQRKLDALQTVWTESTPLAGTLAERYLRTRGITCTLPSEHALRFHPTLHYWDQKAGRSLGEFPGMIALLKSPQKAQPITIHRTFLAEPGRKAPVPCPKKLMPAAVDRAIAELGGSIQLYPADSTTLGVCEGIETALSIRSAHPHLPVWACYSAHVLTKFRPPDGVTKVVVWADLDRNGTGQTAAARLAVELEAVGIETIVQVPGGGECFVKPVDNRWATRQVPVDRLIQRLSADGYRVSEKKSETIDWADVWTHHPQRLIEAFA
jgi:putative DNA primase/helicase